MAGSLSATSAVRQLQPCTGLISVCHHLLIILRALTFSATGRGTGAHLHETGNAQVSDTAAHGFTRPDRRSCRPLPTQYELGDCSPSGAVLQDVARHGFRAAARATPARRPRAHVSQGHLPGGGKAAAWLGDSTSRSAVRCCICSPEPHQETST